jgi:hypothetical protein
MTEKTGNRRDPPISYRPPAALREEFVRRVESSGLSVGAFITQAVFDRDPPRRTRRPPVEKRMLAQLLAQAAAIRGRLDEIAEAGPQDDNADGGTDRERDGLTDALDDLAVIRAALMKMMERAP